MSRLKLIQCPWIRNGIVKPTLDNKVRPEDTHGRNADAGLRGSIGGAKAGEYNGRCATHGTKERLNSRYVSVVIWHTGAG